MQDIMESCFSSRQQVNNYLIWAIRMINSPDDQQSGKYNSKDTS